MEYYPQASNLDTRSASTSADLPGGTFYLVFDNSLQGRAQSGGQEVRITYSYSTSPGPLLLLIAIIIASLVIGVIIAYAFRWSRKRWDGTHPLPRQQNTTWPAAPAKKYCTKCGSPMESWYNACPKCGQLVKPPEGSA